MVERKLMYETVLLDFHGTFTSNKGRLAHALNAAYKEVLGRKVSREEFQTIFNRAEDQHIKDALNTMINGDIPLGVKQRFMETFKNTVDETYIPKHRPLLSTLYSIGANCIIVTNGKEEIVMDLLNKWGVRKYLSEIYGKGTGGKLDKIPRKPHPIVLDFVIDDLRRQGIRVSRDKTLMVGDYEDDIAAGNNCGIHTAFLVTGPNQRPEYYPVRPTYALLDSPNLNIASEWLKNENVYLFRDLPRIVSGDI